MNSTLTQNPNTGNRVAEFRTANRARRARGWRCGTCHDSPNVGNHSVSAPLNIGVADLTNSLGVSYLPVITLRQKADPTKEISTTDPGRALVTGKWADIGKFKGPIPRGLSARAPYFHNGSAASLKDVIEFYNVRFDMELTEREKSDLVAFLRTL